MDRQYADAYRAYVREQQQTAQKKVDELQKLLGDQSQQNKDYASKAAKLAELEEALKRADTAVVDADAKLTEAASDSGGGSMKLVQPPTIPFRPSSPQRAQVLLVALTLGVIA